MNTKITSLESILADSSATIHDRIDALNALTWEYLDINFDQAVHLNQRAQAEIDPINYPKGYAYILQNQGVFAYYQADYMTTITYLNQTINIFENINDLKGLFRSLNILSSAHLRLSNYKNALDFGFKAFEIAQMNQESSQEVSALCQISNVYLTLENFEFALQYQLQGLNISQASEDKEAMTVFLNNIGNVYYQIKDYQRALEYRLAGLKFAQELGHKTNEAAVLNNVGSAYSSLGEKEKALSYHLKALELQEQLAFKGELGITLECVGSLYLQLHQDTLAEKYLNQGLKWAKTVGDIPLEIFAYESLGQLNLNQKKWDNAIQYIELELKLLKEIPSKQRLASAYSILSQIYQEKNDLNQALTYFKLYHELEKEIVNERSETRLKNLQVLHEVEKLRLENNELQRLNKTLKEADYLKDEMVGIVIHDLKNPLSAIILNLSLIQQIYSNQLLKYNLEKLDVFENALYYIENSAIQMQHIIENLLNLSLIESGEFVLKLQPISVYPIIQDIIKRYTQSAHLKKITLEFNPEVLDYNVIGESRALSEILDNLVSNAIKYSPPEKYIWIQVQTQNEFTQIRVQDEGQGLTEDDKLKVFTKFTRLSARPTANEHSSGLGLSIVKKLVKIMNGNVRVESEGKDKGSTFIVELPKAA